MLDEFKEYNLYTFPVPEDLSQDYLETHFPTADVRLRMLGFIQNDFAGTRRAMEVIARHILFRDAAVDLGDSDERMRMCAYAKTALRHWGGFAQNAQSLCEPSAEAPLSACDEHLENWVPRYIRALAAAKGMSPDKADAVVDKWLKKDAGSFSGNLLTTVDWDNDSNVITYTRVIANALRTGPLKRSYLVGKYDQASRELGQYNAKKDAISKLNKSNHSYALAITAAHLLATGNTQPDGYMPLSVAAVYAWMCSDTKDPSVDNWRYAGEPLLERSEWRDGLLRRVNQQWICDGDWQLIDATEGDALLDEFLAAHEGEGYQFFADILPTREDARHKSVLAAGQRYAAPHE